MPPVPRRRQRWPRLLQQRRARRGAAPLDLVSAFQHAPVAIAVLEPGGVLLRANAAMCLLLGRPLQELVGATLLQHTHADDLADAVAACQAISLGTVETSTMECRLLRPDGARRVVISASLVRDPRHAPLHLVLHLQDVTELRALEGDLRHRALHDPLTGLANRTLLTDRLTQTIAACGRDQEVFVLMFLDVDRFKQVNDRYGHETGDLVLVELAARMREAVRPGDTVARLAGDEFLVLCPAVDAQQGAELLRRLLGHLCRPVRTDHGDVPVSLSAGLAVGRADSSPDALLREADQEMYRSKAR